MCPHQNPQLASHLHPGGPIPHNMAKTFDGSPTLERSGYEHRVGRFPPSLLRFLAPTNGGTEGGVKTIEGRFLKKLLLAKDFANERNESLLSNCRVQLILSKGRQMVSKVHTLQSPHNIPTV